MVCLGVMSGFRDGFRGEKFRFQPFLTNCEMKTALLPRSQISFLRIDLLRCLVYEVTGRRLPARVLVEILDADELLVASEDHLLIGQTSRVVTIFWA